MTDEKAWFSETTGRRVTTVEIAEILGVTRRTATTRLRAGLNTDELIAISRALGISPIHALIELDRITYTETLDLFGGNITPVEAADPGILSLELARQLNPPEQQDELDEIAARRADRTHAEAQADDVHHVSTPDVPLHHYDAVADGSPDDEEGNPDDYIP